MSIDLIKLLALILKHTGEIPNILSKGKDAGKAIVTHGAEKVDPVCEFLQAFKPLEADLIAGGFMAANYTEDALRADYAAGGFADKLAALIQFFEDHPLLLNIIMKALGI